MSRVDTGKKTCTTSVMATSRLAYFCVSLKKICIDYRIKRPGGVSKELCEVFIDVLLNAAKNKYLYAFKR